MSEGHTRRYRRDVPDDVPYLLPDPSPARLLAALAECAVDLVELRDPRLVLQALVRRTRLLLGSDLAYLSLNDLAAGETHIETSGNLRAAAAQLHLHVNTVRQRCDRIAALLGPDWSSPGHAGDRLLALRLWAVRGALEEAG